MTRKRRRGMGKAKGAAWERAVCVLLSRWVSGGKREDVFWRSAMSGGRATVRRARGKATDAACGDVTATHSMGEPFLSRFFVECKATANCHLMAYIYPKMKGLRDDHWSKPCHEARQWGRAPFVVVKQNAVPPMVWLNSQALAELAPGLQGYRDFSFKQGLLAYFPHWDLKVFWLEDVLKLVDGTKFTLKRKRVPLVEDADNG